MGLPNAFQPIPSNATHIDVRDTASLLGPGISAAVGLALVLATLQGCGARSEPPPVNAPSALVGTTQIAVLVGYDDKAKLVELSPAALHVEAHGVRRYAAVPGSPVYRLPLSGDPTVLSAKVLCPGGKVDRDLLGTVPCSADQLVVAIMAHPAGTETIAAQVVIDPYGQIIKVAEAE